MKFGKIAFIISYKYNLLNYLLQRWELILNERRKLILSEILWTVTEAWRIYSAFIYNNVFSVIFNPPMDQYSLY